MLSRRQHLARVVVSAVRRQCELPLRDAECTGSNLEGIDKECEAFLVCGAVLATSATALTPHRVELVAHPFGQNLHVQVAESLAIGGCFAVASFVSAAAAAAANANAAAAATTRALVAFRNDCASVVAVCARHGSDKRQTATLLCRRKPVVER